MNRSFIDTSAWFAFINAKDPNHYSIYQFLKKPLGQLITSNYIFDETITLIRSRLGHKIAVEVGKILGDRNVVTLVHVTSEDEHNAWDFFVKHSDKTYSFTDCTSFMIIKRLELKSCIACDSHFKEIGLEVLP